MNFNRLEVKYWTRSITANTDTGELPARIIQSFDRSLLDKANEWVCAVERLSVNLNTVPFVAEGEQMYFYNVDINTAIPTTVIEIAYPLFSLVGLIEYLKEENESLLFTDYEFHLDRDGIVTIHNPVFDTLQFYMSSGLSNILGFPQTSNVIGLNELEIVSTSPRFDCGDPLQGIQLLSNLPLVSDQVGQDRTNILTDFDAPQNLSTSSTFYDVVDAGTTGPPPAWNFQQRQKIHYFPPTRRYLNIISDAPINYLILDCLWVDPEGKVTPIILPIGGTFSIKLGFYKRK